jgi:flagellar motor switch protein FliM
MAQVLSQDEIDALLAANGSQKADGGSATPGDGLGASEMEALKGLFAKVAGSFGPSLSGIMSAEATVHSPVIESLSRNDLVAQLDDEIVEVS